MLHLDFASWRFWTVVGIYICSLYGWKCYNTCNVHYRHLKPMFTALLFGSVLGLWEGGMLWWFSSDHYIPCLMTNHCAWGNGTQIYGATTRPRFIRTISCHAQAHRKSIRAVWALLLEISQFFSKPSFCGLPGSCTKLFISQRKIMKLVSKCNESGIQTK